jgi:Icc-related predicted phosphoesterase
MNRTQQELVSYAVLYSSFLRYSDHFPNHDAFHQLLKFKIFDGDWDQLTQNYAPGCALYDELLKDVKVWEESFDRVRSRLGELKLSNDQLVNFIDLCIELFMKTSDYHSVYDFSNIFVGHELDQKHRRYNEFKFFEYLNRGFGEEKVFDYLISMGNIESLKASYYVNEEEANKLLEQYSSGGRITGEDALKLITTFESQITGDIKVTLGDSEHFFTQTFEHIYNDKQYTIKIKGRTDIELILSYSLKEKNFSDLIREFNSLMKVGVVLSGLTGVINYCEYGDWEYYNKSAKIVDSNGQIIKDEALISAILDDIDFEYLNSLVPTMVEGDDFDSSIRLGINSIAEFSGFNFK